MRVPSVTSLITSESHHFSFTPPQVKVLLNLLKMKSLTVGLEPTKTTHEEKLLSFVKENFLIVERLPASSIHFSPYLGYISSIHKN